MTQRLISICLVNRLRARAFAVENLLFRLATFYVVRMERLTGLGSLLGIHAELLAHGGEDDNV